MTTMRGLAVLGIACAIGMWMWMGGWVVDGLWMWMGCGCGCEWGCEWDVHVDVDVDVNGLAVFFSALLSKEELNPELISTTAQVNKITKQTPITFPTHLSLSTYISTSFPLFLVSFLPSFFPSFLPHTYRQVVLGEGPRIEKISLSCTVKVAGINNDRFQELAKVAKDKCPVSVALANVGVIEVNATLI